MGEVYRARDTMLGREAAIRVLPAAFTQDAEAVARLRREARVLTLELKRIIASGGVR